MRKMHDFFRQRARIVKSIPMTNANEDQDPPANPADDFSLDRTLASSTRCTTARMPCS